MSSHADPMLLLSTVFEGSVTDRAAHGELSNRYPGVGEFKFTASCPLHLDTIGIVQWQY